MHIKEFPRLLKRKVLHIFGYKMGYSKENKRLYFSIPELNIKGRRPGTDIESRMQGLEFLLPKVTCGDYQTVLDAGCAEGLIAREFLQAGAQTVHGLDIQDSSITVAKKLFAAQEDKTYFIQADLLKWGTVLQQHGHILHEQYDIVLCLSVYQHIARIDQAAADRTLVELANRAKHIFAVRSSVPIPQDKIEDTGLKSEPQKTDLRKLNLYIFTRKN